MAADQKFNIQFVQEVENYPCLYNYKLPEYMRKDMAEKAWNDIGKKFNLTGASSGIGAKVAIMFAKDGANVAIVARNIVKLEEVAKKIELFSKPFIIQADISVDADAKLVISKTIDHFGKIDVLVNNAGSILNGRLLEAYGEVMKTNVRTVVYLTSLATPFLTKTKGGIINVSSAALFKASNPPTILPYYVSKATLDHFTRCAALELASVEIRVNTVNPGPVDNDFFVNNGGNDINQHKKAMIDSVPLGYVSTNEEIGSVILFLASEKAKSVTGSSYGIDNGRL